MSDQVREPAPGQNDGFVGEPPAGEADPGDFMSNDQQGDVKDARGAGNPNAESEQGLAGDMGVSSERTGAFEGTENTGTLSSSQGRTHGAEDEHDLVAPDGVEHRQTQEVEENTAELRSHEEIRAANPHPHREDE